MTPSEFGYVMEEAMTGLFSALATSLPTGLLGIAGYVLTALALYALAQRRGLSKPWLSWIPVVNVWILGSLSDQYQYVVKGQNKSKRKVLLVLSILTTLLSAVVFVSGGMMLVSLFQGLIYGASEQQLIQALMSPLMGVLGFALPLFGFSIALAVIRFMALYDVYASMDPGNKSLFLVLSIVFNFTEPFFLFFNREKDLGMPPRREEMDAIPQQPQWQPPQPPQEPWETPQEPDYL